MNLTMLYKSESSKGFTLIELLIAVAIFTLVVAITTGLFISSIRVQRESLASQELLDGAGYVLEYMSRALRTAAKDLTGDCLTAAYIKNNYAYIDSHLRFLNYQGKCQEFFLEGGQLQKRESDDNKANFNNPLPLTPSNLFVEQFSIGPSDSWDQDDFDQPLVTLSLIIRAVGQKPETQPRLVIQTTISQRNLDFKQ